eukprot:4653854-Alexandrium_andersonii.AAC.1
MVSVDEMVAIAALCPGPGQGQERSLSPRLARRPRVQHQKCSEACTSRGPSARAHRRHMAGNTD